MDVRNCCRNNLRVKKKLLQLTVMMDVRNCCPQAETEGPGCEDPDWKHHTRPNGLQDGHARHSGQLEA